MRSVDDVRRLASSYWRNHAAELLGAHVRGVGSAAIAQWPLHPPTEAAMARNPDAVAGWIAGWRRLGDEPGVAVEWVTKRYRAFGAQRLPDRVAFSAPALAAFAGRPREWHTATAAIAQVARAWPGAALWEAAASQARTLWTLSEPDTIALIAVIAWIEAHPHSGLWERELPVVGVDTKWLERHRTLVDAFAEAITGASTGVRRPGVKFRVRLLDPAAPGPDDFSVDLAGLAALPIRPQRVIIVENLTSVGALPSLPATVAVHGMGFAAPLLTEVGWISAAEQQSYWGDLDTYGFQILGRVREALPTLESMLMDEATFLAHEHLTVPEPAPFRGEIGHLTADERAALALVRRGDRRLEQERIARDHIARSLSSPV